MTLREQFEKETGLERPIEPYSCNENAEDWAKISAYEEEYSNWLEQRLEVVSHDTAVKCTNCGAEKINRGYNKTEVDPNADGTYRDIVFDVCDKCGTAINVEFFD